MDLCVHAWWYVYLCSMQDECVSCPYVDIKNTSMNKCSYNKAALEWSLRPSSQTEYMQNNTVL